MPNAWPVLEVHDFLHVLPALLFLFTFLSNFFFFFFRRKQLWTREKNSFLGDTQKATASVNTVSFILPNGNSLWISFPQDEMWISSLSLLVLWTRVEYFEFLLTFSALAGYFLPNILIIFKILASDKWSFNKVLFFKIFQVQFIIVWCDKDKYSTNNEKLSKWECLSSIVCREVH